MASATFSIWRGTAAEGKFFKYTTEISEGMVVLDAVHKIQAEQANDMAVRWECKSGQSGSCFAPKNRGPPPVCMTRGQQPPLGTPMEDETERKISSFRSIGAHR